MEQEGLSIRSKIVKDLVADYNKVNLRGVENRKNSEFDKSYRYPEHFQVEQIEDSPFPMELLSWRFSGSPWIVLQLHGGGYVLPFRNTYRMAAGLYSEVADGAKVLSIDYRVAPEHPYPAALEDALYAYNWILEHGYTSNHIIVAGDSAGGGLSLALVQYLRDHKMPMPGGIVAMSPWTDLTASGPSYDDKYEIDPVFGNTRDSLIYNSPYIGEEDPKNPYISPVFGDYEGFPPMLIQVGTDEMLLSDSQMVAKKAREAGVPVRYTEYPEMFHIFQMAGKVMQESKKAWAEVDRFFTVIAQMQKDDNLRKDSHKK